MKPWESGVVMIETLVTLPLVLVTILAAWQLAEVTVADLAVGWAARIAARSAAVHADDAGPTAERAAAQAMAPLTQVLGAAPVVELALCMAEGTSTEPHDWPQLLADAHGAAAFEAVVHFDFPLRVPLAAALFGGSPRTLTRTARFPVMYAPAK